MPKTTKVVKIEGTTDWDIIRSKIARDYYEPEGTPPPQPARDAVEKERLERYEKRADVLREEFKSDCLRIMRGDGFPENQAQSIFHRCYKKGEDLYEIVDLLEEYFTPLPENAPETPERDVETTLKHNIWAGRYETAIPYPTGALAKDPTLKKLRQADEHRLQELFKTHALQVVGLWPRRGLDGYERGGESRGEDSLGGGFRINHPKAEVVWNKAWERGHDSGLNEVFSELEDLADLVK